MTTAQTLLLLAEIWVWTGLGVALVFLTVGVDRVEPNIRRAFIVRPMLVPGVVLLWPLVVWRWVVLETGRDRPLARHRPQRRVHRWAWIVFAALIPAILVSGLILRQDGPREQAPVRLEAPR